jgi:hypothetical protein
MIRRKKTQTGTQKEAVILPTRAARVRKARTTKRRTLPRSLYKSSRRRAPQMKKLPTKPRKT